MVVLSGEPGSAGSPSVPPTVLEENLGDYWNMVSMGQLSFLSPEGNIKHTWKNGETAQAYI